MRKRKLELDQLEVESFATASSPSPRPGTVFAHASAVHDGCVYPTPSCPPGQTYGEFTCHCLYPRTDPDHVCCNSGVWCSEGCGGGGTGACGTDRTNCNCATEFYTDCCQTNEPC